MRKFKLLALAFIIGSASLFAADVEDPEVPAEAVRNEIIQLLKAPEFVITEDINVIIKFTFSSEGEMVVLCPGCNNKDVMNYIRKNLNYKKFKNPGIRDKIYTMPLKLKAA